MQTNALDIERGFMILKTYARVVTEHLEESVLFFRGLTGREEDTRFSTDTGAIVAIGDFCIIGTTADAAGALREIVGPIVVDDLEQTKTTLVREGAVITAAPSKAPTGRVMYARSSSGVLTEWLEYTPELLKLVLAR
jgi:hypothetical protein